MLYSVLIRRWMGIVVLLAICRPTFAATYVVSLSGFDTNNGSEATPWRTIQKSADTAQAGDLVRVLAGAYDERVTTKRGGTSEVARITFQAEGKATMRGWIVNHPYITLRGFDITGHSSASQTDGYVNVGNNGDNTVFETNTVRDGIFLLSTNISFQDNSPNADTITCSSGGFLAAGFKPGQFVSVGRGYRILGPPNAGAGTITNVTDTVLTVNFSVVNEGPTNIYLSASIAYGLVTAAGATNCVFRGNTFTNLSFDSWFVGGYNNLFESNVLAACHGWDAMHYMGTNMTFRGNFILNSPLVVYQISPDVFENIAQSPYQNVLFEQNFVIGFDGVLASQKGTAGNSSDLIYSHNVFVDVGSFTIQYPRSTFVNNTFLRVSAIGNAVSAPLRHPISFSSAPTEYAILKNNVFVGCGAGGAEATRGWYEFSSTNSFNLSSRQNNFVAGPSPAFAAKTGFQENQPLLNGGDPGFVNIDDPLGPDGLPFTEDDGLRLAAGSKLRLAGFGGVDLGAYNTITPQLPLVASAPGNGLLTLSWPRETPDFILEQATEVDGAWSPVGGVVVNGLMRSATVGTTNGAGFFRLTK